MDPRHLDPEQLRVLVDGSLGAPDVVTLSPSQAAEGSAALKLVAIVAAITSGDFRVAEAVKARAFNDAGVMLEHLPDQRAFMTTSLVDGGHIAVRSRQSTETHVLDNGSVVVPVREDDVYVVDGPSGSVVFGVDRGMLVVVAPANVVDPLVDVAAEAGLHALAGQGWLGDAVAGYLARGTTWGNVCAMAVLGRGALVDSDPAVVDERIAAPLRAARAWSQQQRRTVHDLAIARVAHVVEELDELNDALEQAAGADVDDDLLARTDRICRAREELAAVHLMLIEAGAADRLPTALAMLDERGEEVAAGFPLVDKDDADDVVAAGAALTPDEWWTRHITG
jgi:hypothetical protein